MSVGCLGSLNHQQLSSSLQLEAYFERLKERTAFQQAPLERLVSRGCVFQQKKICCLPKNSGEMLLLCNVGPFSSASDVPWSCWMF